MVLGGVAATFVIVASAVATLVLVAVAVAPPGVIVAVAVEVAPAGGVAVAGTVGVAVCARAIGGAAHGRATILANSTLVIRIAVARMQISSFTPWGNIRQARR
jgi:hypothetical protein